jgi:hypothetical protein
MGQVRLGYEGQSVVAPFPCSGGAAPPGNRLGPPREPVHSTRAVGTRLVGSITWLRDSGRLLRVATLPPRTASSSLRGPRLFIVCYAR